MKELHNHIFSNTTCISKETMLKFINKQLSKNELHEVETHMLDCELCTDAYEGMAYAENSSLLFAIDNQIDKRTGTGSFKTSIMRNLMVAASILVLIFGTYFTFSFFNKTINDENNLAINETVETRPQLFKEEITKESTALNTSEILVIDEDKTIETKQAEINTPTPVLGDQLTMDVEEDEIAEPLFETAIVADEEIIITGNNRDKNRLFDSESNLAEDDIDNTKPITTTSTYGYTALNFEERTDESLKKEAKNKTRNKKADKKRRSKSNNQSSFYDKAAPVEETLSFNNINQQKKLTINGYKVINYIDEYQDLYDAKNEMSIESNSIPAGFENKSEKDISEKEQEESVIEITYKETLEKAIRLYKNKRYKESLAEFDVILWKHPEEVNAQFYSGLCFYYLEQYDLAKMKFNTVLKNKETEFNEEANWHKALILIELKENQNAKKLLEKIIAKNGFYKGKAEKKLAEFHKKK